MSVLHQQSKHWKSCDHKDEPFETPLRSSAGSKTNIKVTIFVCMYAEGLNSYVLYIIHAYQVYLGVIVCILKESIADYKISKPKIKL